MAFVTTTALLAGVFVNSIGVNTHIDSFEFGYQNLPVVESSLKYLGIHNLRDCACHSFDLTYWGEVASATGVKFDDVMPEGSPTDMQVALALVPQFASAGLLNFVEGGNEEDDPVAIADGNSLAYTASFQQQVYAMGHAHGLPVVNMSFGSGWTAANGWQGDYGAVGNLAAYADYANPHTYPAVANGQPNQTIVALDGLAQLAAKGRPNFVTEIGWNASTSTRSIVAADMLSGILDSARDGNSRTYIYALFDDSGGAWGLMTTSGSANPSGLAMHNLTTLLADTGTNATTLTPGTLSYQLTGTLGGESTVVFEKSDGSYWLAVWDEVGGSDPATLTLAAAAQEIQVFDPLTSTTAIQTVSNVSTVSFTLADHPLLVKITPATAAPPSTTPSPAAVISSTTNNSVLTGGTASNAIYAYGAGDTITAGSGTYLIQAFGGSSTINTGSGTVGVHVGGAGNKITVGSGTTTIYDSSTGSSITLGKIGTPSTGIYGYSLSNGNTLNLTQLMAGTQWNGSQATLGNYLKVTTSGSNATITVNPSGQANGTTYPVATLYGYGYLTLATLAASSTM